MPLDIFKYMLEASKVPDIVEIAISTRPDCIREDYLDVLNRIRETTRIQITIELGLQTVNYHTLKKNISAVILLQNILTPFFVSIDMVMISVLM